MLHDESHVSHVGPLVVVRLMLHVRVHERLEWILRHRGELWSLQKYEQTDAVVLDRPWADQQYLARKWFLRMST
jgi:hypothetical protein